MATRSRAVVSVGHVQRRHGIVQLLPEKQPGAVHASLHDGDAEAQELRDLGIRQAPDVTQHQHAPVRGGQLLDRRGQRDRKSTRLNSSHMSISYAVFCLKKKKKDKYTTISWKKKKTKK